MLTTADVPGVEEPSPALIYPLSSSGSPIDLGRRVPRVGEHTDEVLGELGYTVGGDRRAASGAGRVRGCTRPAGAHRSDGGAQPSTPMVSVPV